MFLSYNHADRISARALGVHLLLAGAEVWYDEWEIRAGDSIPGRLNEGLAGFDMFVLVWSQHAVRSDWVRREMEAALDRSIADAKVRIIPVRLDGSDLPALLRPLKRLDMIEVADIAAVVREIMGFPDDRSRRRAIQEVLESSDIELEFFHGYGPAIGCRKCGAGVGALVGWQATDDERDAIYAGVRCKECGWEDGGEV